MQPLLLGSSVRDDNLTLTADLTNPDIFYDGHIALQRDALHIVRTAYLWNSTAHQRIAICNHGEATISFTTSASTWTTGNDWYTRYGVLPAGGFAVVRRLPFASTASWPCAVT